MRDKTKGMKEITRVRKDFIILPNKKINRLQFDKNQD